MVKRESKPSHLIKRYNTYFAVLFVPKDIQYIIGKAKFSKSTGTDNKKLAETIAQVHVMGWKAEIESARSKSDDPLIQSAKDIRKLLKSSPRLTYNFFQGLVSFRHLEKNLHKTT